MYSISELLGGFSTAIATPSPRHRHAIATAIDGLGGVDWDA